jgi:ubiquinone biosynthesis protein
MGRSASGGAGRRSSKPAAAARHRQLKRWTWRELDLRREAASASELAEAMQGFEGYQVPAIDWDRTNGRVMTIEWIDGIKISDMDRLRGGTIDMPDWRSGWC